MIVELKSLLPALEESFEEITRAASAEHNVPEPAAFRQETEVLQFPALQIAPTEETQAISAGDSTVPLLLEQLIQSSERNAASSEKIAELLETRETGSNLTYN